MINEQLLKFIKEQLDFGVQKEEIVKSLVNEGGWILEDVNEAFLAVSKEQKPTSEVLASEADEINTAVTSNNTHFKLKPLIFVLVAVVSLAATAGLYFYLSGISGSSSDLVNLSPEAVFVAQDTSYKTDDVKRLEDLVYWTGLIEEYYEKKGNYPLQDRLQDNIVKVLIVNAQQAEYLYKRTIEEFDNVVIMSTEDLVAELQKELETEFDLRFDPQVILDDTFVWYEYAVIGSGYSMTVSCNLCGTSEISYVSQTENWPTVVSIASPDIAKNYPNVLTLDDFLNHPTYKIWNEKGLPVVNHIQPPINDPVTLTGWGPVKIGGDRTEIEKQIGITVHSGPNLLEYDFINYPEDGVQLVYDVKENILIKIIFYSDHEKTSRDASKKFMGTFMKGFNFNSTVNEVKQLFGEPISENDQSNYIKILKYNNIKFSFYSGEITDITITDPQAPTREYFRKQLQKASVTYNPTLSLDGWGDIKLGATRSTVESILGMEKVQTGGYYASRPDVSVRYSETDDTVVRIFITSDRRSLPNGSVRIDPPIKFTNGLGFYETTIDDIVGLYGEPDERTDDDFAGTTLYYGNVTITFTDGYASGYSTHVLGEFGVE